MLVHQMEVNMAMYSVGSKIENLNWKNQLDELYVLSTFDDVEFDTPHTFYVVKCNNGHRDILRQDEIFKPPFRVGEIVWYNQGENTNRFVTVVQLHCDGCFVTRTDHPATEFKRYNELNKVDTKSGHVDEYGCWVSNEVKIDGNVNTDGGT